MNTKYVFINNSINDAIVLYCQSSKDKESLNYNSFLVCVMRMLCILYDEDKIIDAYYAKSEDDFDKIIMEYDYPKDELDKFKDNFQRFYEFDIGQSDRSIKKKNKYFNLVQKNLIDMLVYKNNKETVKIELKEEFHNLLFTAESKDLFRKSYALLMAYDPYEINKYYEKQGLLVM